ncbi:hypothetical protein LTR85_008250 [Meristemomyces frigidus]|nr:hypothetical protein LTR85_008250 [Meristemomyces frigidus]
MAASDLGHATIANGVIWSNAAYETPPGLYRPLATEQSEFRLLALKLGTWNDRISGTVSHTRLSMWRAPKYETVSYTWGDMHERSSITVNGESLGVSAGSMRALRRLRLPDRDRVLWIDSVCVDQSNLDERTEQVSMMDRIFRSGRQNLVYLGEDDDGRDSASAARIITLIREDMKKEAKDYKALVNLILDEVSVLRDSQTPLGVEFDSKPLLDFYSRQYFRRVWILQEVALSPKSVCHSGEVQLPLNDVLNVAIWIKHKRFWMPSAIQFDKIIDQPAHLWFEAYHAVDGGSRMDELSLLNTFSGKFMSFFDFESTDPRDRVFGVLGIFKGKAQLMAHISRALFGDFPPLLAPDYKKPLMEVYRDATRYMIEESNSLDVFQFMYHRADGVASDANWPSWVPRWHELQVGGGRQGGGGRNPIPLSNFFQASNEDLDSIWRGSLYRVSKLTRSAASSKLKLCAAFDDHSSTMQAQGLRVDVVARTTPVMTGEFLDNVIGWWSALLDTTYGEGYTGPGIRQTDLALTLLAGTGSQGRLATDEELLDFVAFVKYIDQRQEIPPSLHDIAGGRMDVDEDTRRAARYSYSSFQGCNQRRFFKTKAGTLGVGPRTLQEGDNLSVLRGCRWPCLLRPSGEEYELVGCCYARGIMFGEAVKKEQKWQTFRIR